MTKPYSVDMVAERWGCSSQHIRSLIAKGSLPAFRVGKLIRIPAIEVEEFERCSSATGGSGASSITMPEGESAFPPATTQAQKIVRLPNGRRCRLRLT